MPDIVMCLNGNKNGCQYYVTCYRFMATPHFYQSFTDFKPTEGEEKCEYYWKQEIEKL